MCWFLFFLKKKKKRGYLVSSLSNSSFKPSKLGQFVTGPNLHSEFRINCLSIIKKNRRQRSSHHYSVFTTVELRMEEEQISGSINSFSDRYSPIYNFSHDTNPNNYYYYYDEEEEEESSYDHWTKRSKHAPILEEDRISALPDSIFLSILCFLPINDAIKTGVLSKRWASLWTSLPSLSFDSDSFEYLEDFTRAMISMSMPKPYAYLGCWSLRSHTMLAGRWGVSSLKSKIIVFNFTPI